MILTAAEVRRNATAAFGRKQRIAEARSKRIKDLRRAGTVFDKQRDNCNANNRHAD